MGVVTPALPTPLDDPYDAWAGGRDPRFGDSVAAVSFAGPGVVTPALLAPLHDPYGSVKGFSGGHDPPFGGPWFPWSGGRDPVESGIG